MATPRMDITSFVGKLLEQDDVDALREGVKVLAQAVMETEVSGQAPPVRLPVQIRTNMTNRAFQVDYNRANSNLMCCRPMLAELLRHPNNTEGIVSPSAV